MTVSSESRRWVVRNGGWVHLSPGVSGAKARGAPVSRRESTLVFFAFWFHPVPLWSGCCLSLLVKANLCPWSSGSRTKLFSVFSGQAWEYCNFYAQPLTPSGGHKGKHHVIQLTHPDSLLYRGGKSEYPLQVQCIGEVNKSTLSVFSVFAGKHITAPYFRSEKGDGVIKCPHLRGVSALKTQWIVWQRFEDSCLGCLRSYPSRLCPRHIVQSATAATAR